MFATCLSFVQYFSSHPFAYHEYRNNLSISDTWKMKKHFMKNTNTNHRYYFLFYPPYKNRWFTNDPNHNMSKKQQHEKNIRLLRISQQSLNISHMKNEMKTRWKKEKTNHRYYFLFAAQIGLENYVAYWEYRSNLQTSHTWEMTCKPNEK